MTGFNHGMTGAVIALVVKNPAIAIPISFVSHFAQDIVPHWNYGIKRRQGQRTNFFTRRFDSLLSLDFCIAVAAMVVLAFMFPAQKWRIWLCMIVAASPDLMWAYYRLYLEHLKRRKPNYNALARFHIFVQWSQTGLGFAAEIIWFVTAWIIIFKLR